MTETLFAPFPDDFTAKPDAAEVEVLAQWRAKQYREVRYAMQLGLVEGQDRISGSLEIKFKLRKAKEDLVLDWRGTPVRNVRVNDVSVLPDFRNEHLV
ncbi:MAG: hypothetical protein AAB284_00055, partial [Chloroflexota bacterium]